MIASLGTIRRFIIDHFNDEELTHFCFDHYHDVFQNFATDMTVARKAMLLVDYCHRRDQLPALLARISEERPEPFRRVFGQQSRVTIRRINLNKAPPTELHNLPGIGPVLAEAIVGGRPYESIEELTRVSGIGPMRLAAIRNWCDV